MHLLVSTAPFTANKAHCTPDSRHTLSAVLPLQVMRKADLIRKNMAESVKNERNILAMANNPFVVGTACKRLPSWHGRLMHYHTSTCSAVMAWRCQLLSWHLQVTGASLHAPPAFVVSPDIAQHLGSGSAGGVWTYAWPC